MRGFAVNCEGNVTCFGFFAVQLFKACASAVGHRRRLNDGFRLNAALRSRTADQRLFCAEQSVGHRPLSLRTVTEFYLSTDS